MTLINFDSREKLLRLVETVQLDKSYDHSVLNLNKKMLTEYFNKDKPYFPYNKFHLILYLLIVFFIPILIIICLVLLSEMPPPQKIGVICLFTIIYIFYIFIIVSDSPFEDIQENINKKKIIEKEMLDYVIKNIEKYQERK